MSQLLLSIICGIFIGAAAGYLGTLMLEKRMALVAGPLGHLALPGVALALIYGFDMSLGAFPFIILGIILIWFLELKTKLPMEALTAIIFAAGVAIAFLFLPIEQAEAALVGNIIEVSFWEVIFTLILCLLIVIIIKKIFPKMILINIYEDLAKAEGINVKKYNFLYLFCIAIIVSLAVRLVGGLLTAALFAIPVCASRNFSHNMKQYSFLAPFFGVIAVIVGIFIFKITAFPVGPLVILTSTIIFIISIFFQKQKKL